MSYKIRNNNISLTRGDSFVAFLQLTLPNGRPYEPVEGDSLRFAMKKSIKDEECVILKDIPIDTMTLKIDPKDTKWLPFGNYIYDIQLKRGEEDDEYVDTVITTSTFTITEEVE